MKIISNFLDNLMKVKKDSVEVANIVTEDCSKRIGIIWCKEERKFLSVKLVFCFTAKNGFTPAFYGWSNEHDLHNFFKINFPNYKFGPANKTTNAIWNEMEKLS